MLNVLLMRDYDILCNTIYYEMDLQVFVQILINTQNYTNFVKKLKIDLSIYTRL